MEDAQASSPEAAPSSSYRIITELDPPKGTDLQPFLDQALQLKGRVDAIQVTDSEHAIMRMAPLAPCIALKGHSIQPVMTVNGRDRNRISFQADLLAAASMGIEDILIKEGHDPSEGDQPVVKISDDLDMLTMIKCVNSLNNGIDLGGETLNRPTAFNLGVHLELSDDNSINRNLAESLAQMADTGVTSVTLGPTYDLNILEIFVPFAEKCKIKLYTSVMFLKSVAMVRYLNNLPGVPSVPQEFVKKLMNSPVKKDGALQLAADLLRDLTAIGEGTVVLSMGSQDRLPEFLNMIQK